MSNAHPPPYEFPGHLIKQFPALRYFHYEHLPPHVRPVSEKFCKLAGELVLKIDEGTDKAELAAGFRKLLEAKDCAVRALL